MGQDNQPVAWRIVDGEGDYCYSTEPPTDFSVKWSAKYGRVYEPLFASPPVQAEQPAAQEKRVRDPLIGGNVAYAARMHREREFARIDRVVATLAKQAAQQSEPSNEAIDAATRDATDALLDHIYEHGTAAEGIRPRVRAIARAVLALKPAVPAGWRLVPVEPTREMMVALCDVKNQTSTGLRWVARDSDLREAWTAMLAAAPQQGGSNA